MAGEYVEVDTIIRARNANALITGQQFAIEEGLEDKKLTERSRKEWKKERQEIFAKYGWEIIFFDEVELNEKNILTVLKGENYNS